MVRRGFADDALAAVAIGTLCHRLIGNLSIPDFHLLCAEGSEPRIALAKSDFQNHQARFDCDESVGPGSGYPASRSVLTSLVSRRIFERPVGVDDVVSIQDELAVV